MRCGLIGEKLGHSHSKTLQGLLADYHYDLIELAPEDLAKAAGARFAPVCVMENEGT